jgi:hypothetical protein
MPSNRTRRRPAPEAEALEDRLALSNGLPGNDLAVATGAVGASGQVAEVSVTIPASAFGNRQTIVVGVAVQPGAGVSLVPSVRSAAGPGGEALATKPGLGFVPGPHAFATTFVTADQPGTLTLGVAGLKGTTGSFQVTAYLPGDVNGDGQVTLADAQAFVPTFGGATSPRLLTPPQAPAVKPIPPYDLAADANRNGVVAIGDGRYLLRNEALLTPKQPLKIFNVRLAPGEQVVGPHSKNSGGNTNLQDVHVLGQTTPGSIVFTDFARGFFFFNDPPVATDSHGNFQVNFKLTQGINTLTLMAVDPFGQQTIFSYPVDWQAFGARGSRLK